MNSEHSISVEMIDGGHPMVRFALAVATSPVQPVIERSFFVFDGRVSVSLENLEAAKTLRDALSAFIALHEAAENAWTTEEFLALRSATPERDDAFEKMKTADAAEDADAEAEAAREQELKERQSREDESPSRGYPISVSAGANSAGRG